MKTLELDAVGQIVHPLARYAGAATVRAAVYFPRRYDTTTITIPINSWTTATNCPPSSPSTKKPGSRQISAIERVIP